MESKSSRYSHHFGFRKDEEAQDFYEQVGGNMLLQLELWYPYSDWRTYDIVKVLPSMGVNAPRKEYEFARRYRSFFAYAVSLNPLEFFGKYRVLKSQPHALAATV